MKIVGLTGGIGSGKSTVLKQFEDLGIKTYSADKAAKKLINSDEDLIESIKSLFGDNIYDNPWRFPKYIALALYIFVVFT